MIQVHEFTENIKIERNVACIGYFDGVHKGHQLLIKKTVEIANKKGLQPSLITFKPDPYEVIHKEKNKQLNNFDRRLKLFEKFGIKGVIVLPFDEKMMCLSKEDFYFKILAKLNIDTLICGEDFTYAYKGEGKGKDLKKYMNVEVVKPLNYYGKKISSTRIKKAIKEGNLKFANKMLGYEYKK